MASRFCRLAQPLLAALGLLAGTALAATPTATAPVSPMVFKRLSQQDGLSQISVNQALQDSRGFIWLATENGLNRYDGHQVHRYMREPGTPGALASDFIRGMSEDAAGDLWLATEGAGLVRWQRSADRFTTIPLAGKGELAAARRIASTVFIDRKGQIWAGTRGGGVIVLSRSGSLLHEYINDPGRPGSLSSNKVLAITAGPDGSIWIGTDKGINRLRSGASEFERMVHDPADPGSLADNEVLSLLVDGDGSLWVGTFAGGLHRLRPLAQRFEHFQHLPSDVGSLSSNQVSAIFEDAQKRLWVATDDGLNLMNRSTGRFTHIRNDPADPHSLSDNYLKSIAEDRSGLLWFGTLTGGVNRWNPRSWSLGLRTPRELAGNKVMAFAASPDCSTLWIGTIGSGLLKSDCYGQQLQAFTPANGFPALSGEQVMSLLAHSSGDLWIGTMTGGINRYNPRQGTLQVYRHDPANPGSLGADGIMSLYESADGAVWAGTFGGGLAQINPHTNQVRRYESLPGNTASLSSPRATAIAEAGPGRIWVGTDGGGLNLLNRNSGLVEYFGQDANSRDGLGAETIYALYHDEHDTLWIGTAGGGLARLENASTVKAPGRFKRMSTRDGLSSNVIYGIRADRSGMLWLSSNNGLMRLDPKTLQIREFHRSNGLLGEEFHFGSHYAAADGRLFFGGTSGFNAFNPLRVESNSIPPQLVLTGLEKFNRPIPLGEATGQVRNLELAYDDDVITFEFAALDYAAPESNRYSYFLQGFDREWTSPGPLTRATYTDLAAGDYALLLRAANSDGVWSPQTLAINVHVARPPWFSWWAFALYILALGAATKLFLRWRFRKMENHARYLQLAYYDRVTGLPNLQLFRQRADVALKRAQSRSETLAMLCIQVGGFRQTSLGHEAIDDVLRGFATRLNHLIHGGIDSVEQRDVARLASDSFIIYFCSADAVSEAEALVQKLMKETADPICSHRIAVAPSFGLAVFPSHGNSAAELVTYADTAASTAALQRKKGLVHYQQAMTSAALERVSLENDLRQALAESQLQLFFQPKYDMHRRMTGSEALLRWTHPVRGPVSPAQFIPLAEESDLIQVLDDFVVTSACRILREWLELGLHVLPVAVNISAEDLSTGRIVGVLQQALRSYRIEPSLLEIEITESALMRDVEQVANSLAQLKQAGHSLVLDDFGTGYSSLTHLQRFPIDTVKIDRSFVVSGEASTGASVCQGIVGLAKSLRLKTVAEGVETQAQMDYMLSTGCDELQGWLFSKALPQKDFEQLLPLSTHLPSGTPPAITQLAA